MESFAEFSSLEAPGEICERSDAAGHTIQLQRQASVSKDRQTGCLILFLQCLISSRKLDPTVFRRSWHGEASWYSMSPWTSIPGSRVACNPGAWNLALELMWTALGAKISDKFAPGMGWSGVDVGDIKMQRICAAAVSFMLFVFVTFLHVLGGRAMFSRKTSGIWQGIIIYI